MRSFKRWFKVEDPKLSGLIDSKNRDSLSTSKPVAAVIVAVGFVMALGIAPVALSSATQLEAEPLAKQEHNIIPVDESSSGDRGHYTAVRVPSYSSIISALADPNSPQSYAYSLVESRGWPVEEFTCLYNLWNRESRWRVDAENKSSGAYGIPQSLPGSKMKSAGDDWRTNFKTQINWGIGYIKGRYGTPCGAWNHSQLKGWY